MGADHSCSLTDDGVRCWGGNNFGQIDVPQGLRNPRTIFSGSTHSCSQTDDGLRCWGFNIFEEVGMPAILSEARPFVMDLRELSRRSYGNKSRFLEAVGSLIESFGPSERDLPSKSTVFTFLGLEMFFRYHSSDHFQGKVLSDWEYYRKISAEQGIESSLRDFPRSLYFLKISFNVIDAALAAIQADMQLPEREEIARIQGVLANLRSRGEVDFSAIADFVSRVRGSSALQAALVGENFAAFRELINQQLVWLAAE